MDHCQIKKHLAINLLQDSTSLDYHLRDALQYHVYGSEPLILLDTILHRATDFDNYHFNATTNSSISKSVERILPYTDGIKSHQEFVHSKVKLDQKRANNHEQSYIAGRLFQQSEAKHLLKLASYFITSDKVI